MTDTAYTIGELRQAMRETGNEGLASTFLDKITEQADKNRAVKEGTGFTEEQVRKAVMGRAKQSGYGDESAGRFTGDVIKRLREPETVPEPVEGGVYKSSAKILYRYTGGHWMVYRRESGGWLWLDVTPGPVSEMEWVL